MGTSEFAFLDFALCAHADIAAGFDAAMSASQSFGALLLTVDVAMVEWMASELTLVVTFKLMSTLLLTTSINHLPIKRRFDPRLSIMVGA